VTITTADPIRIDAPPLKYEPALDGIRAMAVLIVMLYHYGLDSKLHGGVITVDWFFVLSGFLITNLMLDERNRQGLISLKGFYHRRILRLFPAMYVFLGFMTVAAILSSTLRNDFNIFAEIGSAALYSYHLLIGFFGMEDRALLHIWTLSVEEWFYFFWPLALVWGLSKQKNQKVLLIGCGLFMAFWMGARLSAGIAGVDTDVDFNSSDPYPYWLEVIWRFSIMRFDVLVMGCLLAILRRRLFPLTPEIRKWINISGIIGGVLVITFLLGSGRIPGFAPFTSIGYNVALYGVCAAALWLHIFPDKAVSRFMSTRFLTFTGKRSYGLYLWHMVPFVIIGKGTGMSGFLMRAPIMLLATYGLAELSWRFVESPFIKRKHKKYTNVSGR
jgi:peptidoglycan/LPS O-acetylase OafA/YrhL